MHSNPKLLAQVSTADGLSQQVNEEPHRPKRRSNVSVRLIEGEVVVLDRQAGLIHQLNQTASYIWDRCNGQLTVAEIADQMALTFDVDFRTAAEDVVTIIRQFQNQRLLESA
jgi:hypothetical protein